MEQRGRSERPVSVTNASARPARPVSGHDKKKSGRSQVRPRRPLVVSDLEQFDLDVLGLVAEVDKGAVAV